MDISHLFVSAIGAVGGGAFVGKVVQWVGRAVTRRADRKVKLEEKRISADSNVKVAEIEAEAQRDVAGITGQHAVLSEANVFIRELRAEREEDRKRLHQCEERHERTERELHTTREMLDQTIVQVRAWEDRASAAEATFQDALRDAADCKREREIDRKRLNALDQEMRDLRSRFK